MATTFETSFNLPPGTTWMTWTAFKAMMLAEGLAVALRYYDDGTVYTIYLFDGPLVYACPIWKGTVPAGIIASGYGQTQNDSDKNDFETIYKAGANKRIASFTQPQRATSSAVSSIPYVATTDTQLLASNTSRVGATIVNDANATLYVKEGTGASPTSYTVALGRGDTYELPVPVYAGQINGYWTTGGSGAARVTERV